MMLIITTALVTFFLSFQICRWIRDRSNQWGLIDVPNQRSSHVCPTPKGGGIAIVLSFILALGFWHVVVLPLGRNMWLIIGGALMMASLGYASDRWVISPFIRMAAQTVIATLVAWKIGTCTTLFIIHRFEVGVGGVIFAIVWLVAVTNFYNFMDGIDGLAAMQAVFSGLALSCLGGLLPMIVLIPVGILFMAATAGFLILNLSTRKIFMGDVGSYFIGFFLAAAGLLNPRLLVPVAIVLGVFIADTIVTLIIRIARKERWYQAHRSHFYQRAVRLGYSHFRVTGVLSAIFLLLTILASLYIRAFFAMQLFIILIVLIIFGGLAAWVILKEDKQNRGAI